MEMDATSYRNFNFLWFFGSKDLDHCVVQTKILDFDIQFY